MENLEFISTRFPQEVPRGQTVRVRLGKPYQEHFPRTSTMSIYLINAHADAEKTVPLEQKICGLLPDVIKTKSLENITRKISSGDSELTHVIFLAPGNDASYVDLLSRPPENNSNRSFSSVLCDKSPGAIYKRCRRPGRAV